MPMKKFVCILLLLSLTACSNNSASKNPHKLLLSIKNYNCELKISYFSNKNSNEYIAHQTYSSEGIYSMEFLDNENLKIDYKDSNLNIGSKIANLPIELKEYLEINKNPLFLSYFINTYFNLENSDNVKSTENSIELILPNNNVYLYSAKLQFENNKPYSLTYFDKNGNIKVNIIYSEFTSIA
jgi:outer membrane lipoprotein-sorting protein